MHQSFLAVLAQIETSADRTSVPDTFDWGRVATVTGHTWVFSRVFSHTFSEQFLQGLLCLRSQLSLDQGFQRFSWEALLTGFLLTGPFWLRLRAFRFIRLLELLLHLHLFNGRLLYRSLYQNFHPLPTLQTLLISYLQITVIFNNHCLPIHVLITHHYFLSPSHLKYLLV